MSVVLLIIGFSELDSSIHGTVKLGCHCALYKGLWRYIYTQSNPGKRWGEWSISSHGRFTSKQRTPSTPQKRVLSGPRLLIWTLCRRENSLSPTEIETLFLSYPASSLATVLADVCGCCLPYPIRSLSTFFIFSSIYLTIRVRLSTSIAKQCTFSATAV